MDTIYDYSTLENLIVEHKFSLMNDAKSIFRIEFGKVSTGRSIIQISNEYIFHIYEFGGSPNITLH